MKVCTSSEELWKAAKSIYKVFSSPVCENLSDDLKGNLKWHTNKFVFCAATYLGGAKFGALCSARA